LKDDHNEVAMYGERQKPSIWTIAGILATAVVLVVLLLWTQEVALFPKRGRDLAPRQQMLGEILP
jgi:hypothetical protein